jgi:hypothetical protein
VFGLVQRTQSRAGEIVQMVLSRSPILREVVAPRNGYSGVRIYIQVMSSNHKVQK